jgi:hypothetical protein
MNLYIGIQRHISLTYFVFKIFLSGREEILNVIFFIGLTSGLYEISQGGIRGMS